MGTSGPTRFERLGELSLAVAYAIGPHQQCITGVALLVELAKRYEIELTPRAVALAGQSPLGLLATGAVAKEHIASQISIADRHVVSMDDGDTGWSDDSLFRYSGHMVAIDKESSLLMDPSLEQYVAAGFPNTVVVQRVDLSDPEWGVPLSDESFVVYLPGADRGGWEESYERARTAGYDMVEQIHAHLKSGGAPHTHNVRLDLDGAILT